MENLVANKTDEMEQLDLKTDTDAAAASIGIVDIAAAKVVNVEELYQTDHGETVGFSIVSWNVNSINTVNIKEFIESTMDHPTIVCLQETKVKREDLTKEQALIPDYTSYFAFASTPGYSGVATYCHKVMTPGKCDARLSCDDYGEGLKPQEAKRAEAAGRVLVTQHLIQDPKSGVKRVLNIMNLYCPRLRCSADDGEDNSDYKRMFHLWVGVIAKDMIQRGESVIMIGDFNISHQILDQSEVSDKRTFVNHEFRKLFTDLLNSTLKDTFRLLHPEKEGAFTCWNTRLGCRETNYGTRLDYICVDPELSKFLESANIHQEVMGSDHCPISAKFHSLRVFPAKTVDNLCSQNYRQFTGKQSSITDHFVKKNKAEESTAPPAKKRKVQQQLSLEDFGIKSKTTPTLVSAAADDDDEVAPRTATIALSSLITALNTSAAVEWRALLKPPEAPKCSGHSETCVLRTVKAKGPNQGRQFWACKRGNGKPGDVNANCKFFMWATSAK